MAGNQIRTRKVVVEAQGHFLKLSIKQRGFPRPHGLRGAISDFSQASRKRMLETLARVDTDNAGFICFVTLTYPERDGPPSASETERDRRTFLKRIQREHTKASAIWRREWKERVHGEFIGRSFPHYHLLCFGLPFVHHTEINSHWREVLEYDGYVRTEIKGIRAWRQAFYYVSKYMGKVEETKRPSVVVAGGEQPPATATEAAACSLVYVSKMTAEFKRPDRKIGRSWGVFNRKKCPFAELKRVELARGPWIKLAKEEARTVWSGVNDDPECGFSLFVDDAPDWLKRLCGLGETSPFQFNAEGEYDPLPF